MKGLRSRAGAARRGVGHHDPGRRPGRLHSRCGPHSRRRPTCRLTTRGRRRAARLRRRPWGARRRGRDAPRPVPSSTCSRSRSIARSSASRCTQVREVIRVSEITRVPQAPAHVRGRRPTCGGGSWPSSSCASRLGLDAGGADAARAAMVVVEVRGRVLGLLVDAVSQVTKVPQASVAPRRRKSFPAKADYVTGVARWQSRLIILLDLEKALAADRVAHTMGASDAELRADHQGLDDPTEDPHRLRRGAGADRAARLARAPRADRMNAGSRRGDCAGGGTASSSDSRTAILMLLVVTDRPGRSRSLCCSPGSSPIRSPVSAFWPSRCPRATSPPTSGASRATRSAGWSTRCARW